MSEERPRGRRPEGPDRRGRRRGPGFGPRNGEGVVAQAEESVELLAGVLPCGQVVQPASGFGGLLVRIDPQLCQLLVVPDPRIVDLLDDALEARAGDEAVHGILDMMHAGAAYPVLQWAVPIHPTVSELIPTLVGDLKPADTDEAVQRSMRMMV